MANVYEQNALPPLGAWRIAGQALVMSARHIGVFAVIAVPPWLVYLGLIALLGEVGGIIVGAFGGCILWALTLSALTLAAYQLHEGIKIDLQEILRRTIATFLPMFFCLLIALFAINFAYNFFVIPGIYVSGLFAVVLPVAVIEGKGMESLSRCVDLARHYRWSTGGLWFFFSIALYLVVIMMLLPFIVLAESDSFEDLAVFGWGAAGIVITMSVVNITTAVLAALMYARLFEIDEGFNNLEEVFD